MTVAEAVANRLKRLQKGRPFTGGIFSQIGSRKSVNKALSKLVRTGLLERVVRGVYMRPKLSRYIGRVRADPIAVMKVITKANGETVQIHGSEVVRRMGLSTQMQIVPTYYTSGSTREIRVGNAVVRLEHLPRRRLQHAGTKIGEVLTALHYVGKDGLSASVAAKIAGKLSDGEILQLLACHMPKWMRAVMRRVWIDHSP